MASGNLRSVIRVKTMARAAITPNEAFSEEAGQEMCNAYARLREEAKALTERAGWSSAEEFDRELPPITETFTEEPRAGTTPIQRAHQRSYNAISSGRRARVLLGQLAAWAEGHQEAFELEEQFKADAAAKAATQPRRAPGFGV